MIPTGARDHEIAGSPAFVGKCLDARLIPPITIECSLGKGSSVLRRSRIRVGGTNERILALAELANAWNIKQRNGMSLGQRSYGGSGE